MQIFKNKMLTPRVFVATIALLAAFAINAQYSIYNLAGDVTILHAGTQVHAEKGMKLILPDYIELPDANCWLQVLSERGSNKNIYRQDGPGTFSVSQILRNAEIASADNQKNLHNNIKLTTNHHTGPVFDETGMVTRDKITAADDYAAMPDLMQLAQLIAQALTDTTTVSINNLSIDLSIAADHLTAHNDEVFNIEINVLMLKGSLVEVSRLGQTGVGILLMPGQSIHKTDTAVAPSHQVAFATAEGIDLAALADAIDNIVAGNAPMVDIDPDIPVAIISALQ